MTVEQMIAAIRDAVDQASRGTPEIEVMAVLVNESESWRMRLRELHDEEADAEPQ